MFAQLCSIQGGNTVVSQVAGSTQVEVQPELIQFLSNFNDIFEEPKGLPPVRTQNRKIPLKPNTQPPNSRPYRYPYIQKAKIERIMKELLPTRMIRPSTSPYSSPILLVKKDNS